MTILDNLNSKHLQVLFTDEEAALNFAYQCDMLYDDGVCDSTYRCQGNYVIVADSSTKTGYRLRCPVCHKTRSLFYNSIFTRSNIKINTILHLIYCWSQELSCKFTAYECEVNIKTVTNYFQAFRQACSFNIKKKAYIPNWGS